MRPVLKKGAKVICVLDGGPINGPFSAGYMKELYNSLLEKGVEIAEIFACSGSVPSALLGCIHEYDKLCDSWMEISPKEVVGRPSKDNKLQSYKFTTSCLFRLWKEGSVFESKFLEELFSKKCELDRIFSDESIPVQFHAYDIVNRKRIIFSNKVSEHQHYFIIGALASMGLVPFFGPQRIRNAIGAGLINKKKARYLTDPSTGKKYQGVLMIDGGFIGSLILSEAMRRGYDAIILVDIHGFKHAKNNITDIDTPISWSELLSIGFHSITTVSAQGAINITQRINEELRVRDRLKRYRRKLIKLSDSQAGSNMAVNELDRIITQMNTGTLGLEDKKRTPIVIGSNPDRAFKFDFSNFKSEQIADLLNAGQESAKKTVSKLKFAD